MDRESLIRRYRNWYSKLLRFYPKAYRDRFAEGMEQTFHDLCRERVQSGRGFVSFAMWMFLETSAGIVRENSTNFIMKNKNILYIALVTGLILLVPFLSSAPWTGFDFAVAGTLLFGTGLTYELISRRGGNLAYRFALGLALAAALILVWLNLAVGLIGSEENPANLMYAGVLAIGAIGAIIARFRPSGMARALFTTAIAQALVPVIALIIFRPPITPGVFGVFVLNGFFVALFLGSALLFRRATRAVANSR